MDRLPLSAGWALLALASNPAFAHAVDGETAGFVHALIHRVWGADHAAAMITTGSVIALIALGILSWLRRRRARSGRSPTF